MVSIKNNEQDSAQRSSMPVILGMPRELRQRIFCRFSVLVLKKHCFLDDKGTEVKITKSAHDVFFALALHFYNIYTGRCNPSHKVLSDFTGYSVKTVSRAIKSLEKIGLISVKHDYIFLNPSKLKK